MLSESEAFIQPSKRTIDPPSRKKCFEHTDLEWRLAQIPDGAACRGAFLNMLDARAAELGHETQRAYREYFQLYRFSPFKFYPVKDYLVRIVTLAQIHFGGPEIYRGLFHIQAASFQSWKRTLIGHTMFAMLRIDLETILRVAQAGHSANHMVNYLKMRVQRVRPDRLVVHFTPEYVYIEHAMAGAIAGIAEACDQKIELDVQMKNPFDGEIGITLL